MFLLDPKIEIGNASVLQPTPIEIAKDLPNLIVDESFPHTVTDVHLEGLKRKADIGIQELNASLLQPATHEAMDEN